MADNGVNGVNGHQEMEQISDLKREISQVDNSVDEEVVIPTQTTTEMLTRENDENDDSGCTSDGEEDESTHVDVLEKRINGSIIRQNTYTVTSSSDVQEQSSQILKQEDLEAVNLLQRQNTYTVKRTKVDSQLQQSEIMESFSETCKTVELKYETSKYSSTSEKMESEQVIHKNEKVEVEPNLHDNEISKIENDSPLNIADNMEYKIEESDYNEPGDALNNGTEMPQTEKKKEEDQYVTAEEVRNQKHKLQVSAVESGGSNTTDALIQEKDGEVITNLEKRRSIDDLSRTSKEVEQLISDIRDPNLDCSLDDIAAMIDSKDDKIEKEKIRGSPEFATAATMIDKNPDKGYDPEDPAVKGLEDWECSNLTSSFDSVIKEKDDKKSKFKNALKRFSRTDEKYSEENRSLISETDYKNISQDPREYRRTIEDENDQVSPGCVGTSLLYVFLKIFD